MVSNGIFQFSMDFSAQGLVTVGTRAQSGPELRVVLAAGVSATLFSRQSLTEPSTRRLSLAKDHLMAKANETFSVPWCVEKIPREAHPARPATSTQGGMVSVPLGNLRTAARCVCTG